MGVANSFVSLGRWKRCCRHEKLRKHLYRAPAWTPSALLGLKWKRCYPLSIWLYLLSTTHLACWGATLALRTRDSGAAEERERGAGATWPTKIFFVGIALHFLDALSCVFLCLCNLITLKTQFIFTICGRPFKKITFSPSNNFSYRVSQKRCTIECCWNYSAQVISPVTGTPCVRKNVLGPFFTKTKQDQALLSHVHGKIQPHSTQFLLWFFFY